MVLSIAVYVLITVLLYVSYPIYVDGAIVVHLIWVFLVINGIFSHIISDCFYVWCKCTIRKNIVLLVLIVARNYSSNCIIIRCSVKYYITVICYHFTDCIIIIYYHFLLLELVIKNLNKIYVLVCQVCFLNLWDVSWCSCTISWRCWNCWRCCCNALLSEYFSLLKILLHIKLTQCV